MARFIELNVKGENGTSLPVMINTDHIVSFHISKGGDVIVSLPMGGHLVSETYEQLQELLKEPELIEGLSIVDQVWPSCLKDPSGV